MYVIEDFRDDVLEMLGVNRFETLLNDMVSILVLNALQDLRLQLGDNLLLDLRTSFQLLQRFLNNSTSVRVQ